MTNTDTDTFTFTDREAFVWLGFRRDASLAFRVELPRDKTETLRILEAVGSYNRFRPDEAFAVIDGWYEYVARFAIAREGSVALYATFPHYQHQALNREPRIGGWLEPNPVPVTAGACEVFAQGLMHDLRDIGADELSYNPSTRTVRAWWD